MEGNSTTALNTTRTEKAPTAITTIPLSELITWCTAFALVAVAIIIGNALTIAVFTRKRIIRMRANYFLTTLAVADLLVGAFAVPLYIHQLVWYWKTNSNEKDIFVAFMAIDIFTGFASIFALTTIALERLYAVMWPLKNMVTSKRVYYFVISVIWFLSALVALLYFMNDGLKVFKLRVFFYFVIFFISSSLLIICVAYVLIWKKVTLQKDDSPRQGSKYQEEMEQRKRRTQEKSLVTTLLILSLVFVLTWVPFYVLNIVVFFYAKREPMDIPFEAFCFTKLLHYSNSLANPIVYSIRIPRFARSLLGFFRKRKSALMVSLRLSIKR